MTDDISRRLKAAPTLKVIVMPGKRELEKDEDFDPERDAEDEPMEWAREIERHEPEKIDEGDVEQVSPFTQTRLTARQIAHRRAMLRHLERTAARRGEEAHTSPHPTGRPAVR